VLVGMAAAEVVGAAAEESKVVELDSEDPSHGYSS